MKDLPSLYPMKNYQKISPYQYRYQAHGNGVPIIFHLQSALFPDETTLAQLQGIAETQGVFKQIAVLSDVHPKKGRKCPTGVAVAADRFLPQIMDTAPNCGMRMFGLSLASSKVSKEKIDEIFRKLVQAVPTQKPIGTPINWQTVLDICRFGTKGLTKNLNKEWPFLEQEIQNTFQHGNEFSADEIPDTGSIKAAIPPLFLRMAQLRLGILGMAGNHFLDLMRVEKIEDREKADRLGVFEDQLVFFMHTGSGILGQYASYFYTPKEEEHLLTKLLVNLGRLTMRPDILNNREIKKLRQDSLSFRFKKEFFSIDPDSNVGRAYITAHRASGNFGY
ncbi:MAG: RtcB family protein, partial [Candidatus Moranbacteria bacterium]|nr:RtcB family protein [Candidatus Moranbacteria bacterium]